MITQQPLKPPGTAVVTGASRGFGKAIAATLVAMSWSVVVDARDHAALTRAKRDIGGAPSQVVDIPGDVSEESHRQDLVAAASELGNFRLLVNNASTLGVSPLPPLADYEQGSLLKVFSTNVLSPIRLAQLALPTLREQEGVIVNVSSDAATNVYEGWGGYGASKAALDQASLVMSAEEPDVTVYVFDPGDMRTKMHQEAFPGEDISDRPLPETRVPALVELIANKRPSGRYVASELLAKATL